LVSFWREPFVLHRIIDIDISVIPGLSDFCDVLAEGIGRLREFDATHCCYLGFFMQFATPSFAFAAVSRLRN